VARIKPGRILFEVDGVDTVTAREALRLGASKLSIDTKFVARLEV
jgi:large subunit ribosomal protein L16